MNTISILANGLPVAQPRPRATIRSGRIHVYNKNISKEWKDNIILAFRDYANLNIETPVRIEILYYMKRPKSLMRKKDSVDIMPHIKKPDIDNLNKAVLDALTTIGLWVDDSRVYSILASKYYCRKDDLKTGAYITIIY